MLKAGLAVVYAAKGGAEFGGRRRGKYEAAEAKVEVAKLGLWKQAKGKRVSPGTLKKSGELVGVGKVSSICGWNFA